MDDTIGASWKNEVKNDMSTARRIMRGLLGNEAVAEDKTEMTSEDQPRIVALGWCIDVETRIVTISKQNLLKAIYCFFSVNLTEEFVPAALMEICASLASRYELVCCVLRPFTKALYASYVGMPRGAKIRLGPDAKWAVRMWRSMLCCTLFDEGTYARTFESFGSRPAGHVIQFDASTTGIGVWLQRRNPPGMVQPTVEQSIGAGGLSIWEWDVASESDYQNVAEFTAAVVGLIALIRACVARRLPLPEAVIFKGDSISALTWLDKMKHRGNYAFGASALLNLIVVRYKIQIVGTEFIEGIRNTETDKMSRGTHSGVAFGPGVHVIDLQLDRNQFVQKALELCNPTLVDFHILNFKKFWNDANKLVISLGT